MNNQHKTLFERSEEKVLPFYELKLLLAERELSVAKEMLLAHIDKNGKELLTAFVWKQSALDSVKRDMYVHIGLTMASLLKK